MLSVTFVLPLVADQVMAVPSWSCGFFTAGTIALLEDNKINGCLGHHRGYTKRKKHRYPVNETLKNELLSGNDNVTRVSLCGSILSYNSDSPVWCTNIIVSIWIELNFELNTRMQTYNPVCFDV